MSTNTKDRLSNQDQEQASKLPLNWPVETRYIPDQIYSDAVTPELRNALCRNTPESLTYLKLEPSLNRSPNPNVAIRLINVPDHPACGQRGLFAAQHLIPDAFISLYFGLVHLNSLSDTDPHSDYDLSLDREIGLSVDAARCGNETRFANDYRGIADRPNAEFRDCFIQVPSTKRADGVRWERRVAIFVLSAGKAGKRKAGIASGEEILVNYGKGFWEARRTVAKFRKDEVMMSIAQAAIDAD